MAKEKEEMQQEKPSSRQRLTERYRKNRPDLTWDDETVDNDIDALAADELDEYDNYKRERKEFDDRFNSMLDSDEVAASTFLEMANGGDAVKKLIKALGPDVAEALTSPSADIEEVMNKWREDKKAQAEYERQVEENSAKSIKDVIAFADKHGLDDTKLLEVIDKAKDMADDIFMGIFSESTLEMVLKAGNYDNDIAEAREEGRINGKNETIRRELRKSKPATGLPQSEGVQGMEGAEAAPKKAKSGSLPMFGGITVNKK